MKNRGLDFFSDVKKGKPGSHNKTGMRQHFTSKKQGGKECLIFDERRQNPRWISQGDERKQENRYDNMGK
jgi:hypothetical protein